MGKRRKVVLRIVKWNEHFENNRTRDLKTLSWVPIPNKMHGDGYTRLIDHEDGAAHFGAWVAIIEIASRCFIRGVLARSGKNGDMIAHDADSLARISRIPSTIIATCVSRLLDIGWIEEVQWEQCLAESPQLPAESPHDGDGEVSQKGREGKGREKKKKDDYSPLFESFFHEFPGTAAQRGSKIRAWAKWVGLGKDGVEAAYLVACSAKYKAYLDIEAWRKPMNVAKFLGPDRHFDTYSPVDQSPVGVVAPRPLDAIPMESWPHPCDKGLAGNELGRLATGDTSGVEHLRRMEEHMVKIGRSEDAEIIRKIRRQ